jgi:uncharacterized membrane protein
MKFAPFAVVLGLILASVGGVQGGAIGALFGFVLGLLGAALIAQNDRLRQLERRIDALATRNDNPQSQATPAVIAMPEPVATPEVPPGPLAERPASALPPVATPAWREPQPSATPAPPDMLQRGFAWLREYATSGNVVAKAGVLVLFFGVAFLLKYAVDRNALPIELRLLGTAAAALALIVTGWRLRLRRAAFAMVLQGGGIGFLYLTIFAAARLYQLLPLELAFALMLAVVAASAWLAVRQDASALALLGSVGGFLAPVLTASGSGNHVTLFSYYALLNFGIVAVAWHKAWRVLNWTGFVFTFLIGALWGWRYYTPEHFASTEPFLVLSFLFYLGVAILFAERQQPRLRGYVDGTLVFALPLVSFTLQSQLVRDMEYGRALSALGMGLVYLGAAQWLRSRALAHLRMLSEAFLALGVVLLSLAIPFAFDGHLTAAAWALEGAGLVWIGIRQQRALARHFGCALQFAAGLAFLLMHSDSGSTMAILNAQYLGGVFLGVGALLSSHLLYRDGVGRSATGAGMHPWLLGWGMLWWLGAAAQEIARQVEPRWEDAALLGFGAASVIALVLLAQRLAWGTALRAALCWLPLLAAAAAIAFIDARASGPLADARGIAWILALAASYLALHRAEESASGRVLGASHAMALWLLLFLLAWSSEWLLLGVAGAGSTWTSLGWGLVPALGVAMLAGPAQQLGWPVARWRGLYLGRAALPVAIIALLWVLRANLHAGNPAPLHYLPLLNPMDLAQAASLLLVLYWWQRACTSEQFALRAHPGLLPAVLGISAFMWLNAATARAVHFIGDVAWSSGALHRSAVFQGSISLLWALLALGMMLASTRLAHRRLWLSGAGLLAALMLKLFFVDLAGSGTVARIVSFLGAGALMVLIGYVSPAPPRKAVE